MKRGFYAKLAAINIRKNGRIYIPYILACTLTVMMHYMVISLSKNPGITEMYGGKYVAATLGLGTIIIRLFALIFLFYTNSFLMKRRQKEFGVFNILGLEKKHLAKVIFIETVIVAVISLAAGIGLGIAFDKAMFLVICRVMDTEISLGFFVSGKVILFTIRIFCEIYLLIYLKAVYSLRVSNPIELLRGSAVGEREPKTKWLMALAGAVLLGTGYKMAITIKNPMASIEVFFVAVILVIIATYLLFTAGSIVVLKMLRRNRKFYYQPRHFVSVSGMMHRMKQNAAGLANICILSTMVLVTVSSTSSMMIGMEDLIHVRYPNDFGIYSKAGEAESQKLFGEIDSLCEEKKIPVNSQIEYRYLLFSACQRGNWFETDGSKIDIKKELKDIRSLFFIPVSDYNASAGESRRLNDGEALLFSNREKYQEPVVKVFDREYEITGHLEHFFGNGVSEANITNSYYFVISDKAFGKLAESGRENLGEYCQERTYYGFDTSAGEKEQEELEEKIGKIMASEEFDGQFQGYLETRVGNRKEFKGLYGGLFFLGLFLSVLFIMATVLIIYYKQISEGYEDRQRFEIMQKVGMTQAEVKQTIHSQVLIVFFLPLFAAGVHVAAAFPLIRRILELLSMVNVKLYLICTIVGFLVFAVMYAAIYGLTARTYYKIVRRQ